LPGFEEAEPLGTSFSGAEWAAKRERLSLKTAYVHVFDFFQGWSCLKWFFLDFYFGERYPGSLWCCCLH
jgi:hypothetical protein